jgi:uncharacterized protein
MPSVEEARAWYPEDDPTHGFKHVLRVYKLGEYIAREEDAKWGIVRAAILLHDAHSGGDRVSHHTASAAFAEEVLEAEGWSSEDISAVQHCIRAHRFRGPGERPRTLEAKVLYDADKLDAIGAVGVVRAIAYALQHGQGLYQNPSAKFLETGHKEPGEPHTPMHEYHFKLRHLAKQMFTDTGRRLAQRRHELMTRFFQQLDWEIRGPS